VRTQRFMVQMIMLGISVIGVFFMSPRIWALTITATASGSEAPVQTTFPNTVINGDFEIKSNGLPGAEIVGDGADEATFWSLDFTGDPNFASFPAMGPLVSVWLTLTLTPKVPGPGGVGSDGFSIRELSTAQLLPQAIRDFLQTRIDQLTTIEIELTDFYPAQDILDTVLNDTGAPGNGAGQVALFYGDDAIVSFAQLDLITLTEVLIDIKPGSDPNCININGNGVIPVAVLGSADFDVTHVDIASLTFAGLEVRIKGQGVPQCSEDDVSGDFTTPEGAPDGFPDLVCQFVDDPEKWSPGDGIATLTGALLDGTLLEGSDTICVVP